MAIILRHFRGLALVTCLLGVAAVWQGYVAYRATGFNAALEREDMKTASSTL